MDKDICDSQNVASGASRLKFTRRSQLPHPKMLSKTTCVSSEPASNCSPENRKNSLPLAKSPDVIQTASKTEDASWKGSIGSRVCVGGEKFGTLLYFGPTKFANGIWCGVKLEEPVGKNNGTVGGHKYFTCSQNYGIFAPPEKVTVHEETADRTFVQRNMVNKELVNEKSELIKINPKKKTAVGETFRPNKMMKTVLSETFIEEPEYSNDAKLTHSSSPAQNAFVDLDLGPSAESTPITSVGVNATNVLPFHVADLDEDVEDEGNSNNDDLSELGNVQSGLGQQGSMDHDESLGILTPDQMKDFTLPLDSSCGYQIQTPSDEGIQEIVEEVADVTSETTPVDASSHVAANRWDTPEWVSEFHVWNAGVMELPTPRSKDDHLELISSTISGGDTSNTTETEVENEQSSILQPDLINTTFTDQNVNSVDQSPPVIHDDNVGKIEQTELMTEELSQQLSVENIQAHSIWTKVDDYLSSGLIEPSNMEIIVGRLEVDQIVTQDSLLRVVVKKELDKPADMVVSATSIDTGYQGDVECDLQSDSGTNPISTPVDDKQLTDSLPISLEQRLAGRGDPGSDSDFCSDMGASWTESEMDMEDKSGQRGGGGGRSARIIDGRLYYSSASTLREMRSASSTKENLSVVESGRRESLPNTEETTNAVESANKDVFTESLCDLTMAMKEFAQSEELVPASEARQIPESDNSNFIERIEESASVNIPFSNMVQESSSDTLNSTVTVTLSEQSQNKDDLSPVSCEVNSSQLSASATTTQESQTKEVHNVKAKTPLNKKGNKEATNSKSKTPKKNVMSKIKAMIEATSNKLTNKDPGGSGAYNHQPAKEVKKIPLKNKWNPVMSKIAANRMEEKEKAKIKREVTSRVNTNLTPSKANGHTVNRSPRSEVGVQLTIKSSILKPSATLGTRPGISTKTNQKNLATQKCRESKGRLDTCSEPAMPHNNVGMKSKIAVSERPSTLLLKKHNIHSRSPSELSVASGDSQATTMSQMTLASQSSFKPPLPPPPPLNTSNISMGSNHGPGATKSRRAAAKSLINKQATNSEPVKASSRPSKRGLNDRVSLLHRKPNSQTDKKSVAISSDATSSQIKSNHVQTNGLLKSGHQPDLLSATVGRTFFSQEVSRLEALCETRTKELNIVQIQLKHCAMGFDSMTILINYLTNELNAFEMPAVREELNVMQAKYRETDLQLREYLQANRNLSKEIGELQDKFMLEQSEMQRRFKVELETRQEELAHHHQKMINNLIGDHKSDKDALKLEMENMMSKLKTEFEEQKREELLKHTNAVEELKAVHLKEIEDVQKTYEIKLKDLEPRLKELDHLKVEYAELNKKKIDLEMLLSGDFDVRVQVFVSQRETLQKEADSLSAVLDMKMNQIKKLQQDKVRLDGISEQLDRANETIKKLQAKNEDLNEMVQSKTESERSLSSNNEVLQRQFATRTEDNKRLSLENEALQWKLRQSINGSISSDSDGNPINPTNYFYFWDDEGMNKSSLMSSSWSGHSAVKNGSPCSPRDRFPWSPSHNSCTKSKPVGHYITPSNREVSKVEETDDSSMTNEMSTSPMPLKIKSPRKRKNISVHSSSTANNSPGCSSPVKDVCMITNAESTLVEDGAKFSDDDIGSLLFDDNAIMSPFPLLISENNRSMNQDDKRSELSENNDNFELQDGQTANEAAISEPLNLETEEQADSEVGDIEACRWNNYSNVSIRERCYSESGDVVFEEELQMPELENLYKMSIKDDSYIQLIDIDQNCSKSLTCSSDAHFQLELADDLEELVLEPLTVSGDNDGIGDANEASSSSEEMLGSLEDSSSIVTATETSSKETASAIEEFNENSNNLCTLDYSSDKTIAIPKTTTTVVITFRPNPVRTSSSSSRDSSPGQPILENNVTSEDISEAPNTDEPSSSSRASPLGMDDSFTLDKNAMQSFNKKVYRGIQSPRTSAGEALMADAEGPAMQMYESHRHQLLKKALQDQLPQSGSSCSSNRELSSDDCSPLVGMSKPNTPDLFGSSPLVNPPIINGAIHTDDSWSFSDDDLPSETEI